MEVYTYSKDAIDPSLLTAQINASVNISQDVASMQFGSPDLRIGFASALTEGEQSALAAIVTAHDEADGGQYSKNVYVRSPMSGFINKEEWWESVDEQGVYSGLAWRRTYTYLTGNRLYYFVDQEFFKNGTVKSSVRTDVYAQGTDYIEKRS